MAVDLLPGDSAAIRSAAGDIAGTVPRLRRAHAAAVRLEEVVTGDHWQGEAFQAFRQVVERKPLPQALDHATDRMAEAVSHLEHFAGRFDQNQERLRHLRAQAAALASEGGTELDPAQAVARATRLRAIEEHARAVHEDHRRSLDAVAEAFDRLDDETTFAQPPPSGWDRISGAVGDAVDGLGDVAGDLWDIASSFGTGVYEGLRDMVLGIRDLIVLLDPRGWPELWAQRGQLLEILRYAWDNPGEFLGELGSALLDLDTLFSDPARWLGRRVPDLLLALATVGTGTVAARAAGSVRAASGPSARLGSKVDDVRDVAYATDGLAASDGIAGRYARLDIRGEALGQSGGGAFARTDTALGRLALRLDGLGPAVQGARQLPGTVLDEVRAVTDVPVDAVLNRLPMSAEVHQVVAPWAGRTFGHLVTGGFTSRLGMLDGLLVGAPALSPQAYAGLAGVATLDTLNGGADLVEKAQAVATAATPEPCP